MSYLETLGLKYTVHPSIYLYNYLSIYLSICLLPFIVAHTQLPHTYLQGQDLMRVDKTPSVFLGLFSLCSLLSITLKHPCPNVAKQALHEVSHVGQFSGESED